MDASTLPTREFEVGEEFSFYGHDMGYQGKISHITEQGIYLVDVTSHKGKPLGKFGYTKVELLAAAMPITASVTKDHECFIIDVGFRFSKFICKICNKEM